MGMGLLAYGKATGGASTDQDMVAYTDTDFTQRNSHYTFTAPFNLSAQAIMGATIVRANVGTPTWNAISKFNIEPLIGSVTVPSAPTAQWLTGFPSAIGGRGVPIPMQEEYQVFNTDSASEQVNYWMWITTPDWTSNLPPGILPFWIRFTLTQTGIANAWSGPAAITLEQSLRGGVYAVVGGSAWATNMLAWRLVFPRYKTYNGIRLRPGLLAHNAGNDSPDPQIQVNPFIWGEWGRFQTYELPQFEHAKTAATSSSVEGRLALIYLGQDSSLLQGGQGGVGAGGYGMAGLPSISI